MRLDEFGKVFVKVVEDDDDDAFDAKRSAEFEPDRCDKCNKRLTPRDYQEAEILGQCVKCAAGKKR